MITPMQDGRTRVVRYLSAVPGKQISKIGLGTWQFGSGNGDTATITPTRWRIRHPAVAAIPGASSVEQLERNAAAEIDLTADQYQALADAAARFRPLTGPAALARPARSRFSR